MTLFVQLCRHGIFMEFFPVERQHQQHPATRSTTRTRTRGNNVFLLSYPVLRMRDRGEPGLCTLHSHPALGAHPQGPGQHQDGGQEQLGGRKV